LEDREITPPYVPPLASIEDITLFDTYYTDKAPIITLEDSTKRILTINIEERRSTTLTEEDPFIGFSFMGESEEKQQYIMS